MANGIVVRPDADHANVPALADAYGKMQALSGTDNRSWIYWAEFHGFNRYDCWHHSRVGPGPGELFPYDLFLPWHRAYLVYFDRAAREQNPAAILPWWDWTTDESHTNGLPVAYRTGDESLTSGPVPEIPPSQPARRTARNPRPPGILPTPEQVESLLQLTSFEDFSNQLQSVHDGVHIWVRGDMGSVATAAFDPVFWAHHAMIDRIWYLWQLRHGVNNIPSNYLDKALFPGLTVQQVLDVRTLGYDYASASVAAGEEVPPGTGGSEESPAAEGEGGAGGGGAGGGDAGGAPPDQGEAEPPTTGEKYETPEVYVGALDPSYARADIELHGVDHAGASYEGRVYIDNPDADENTGDDVDAGYAGRYFVFGHGGCLGDDPSHCEVKERDVYDVRPGHPLTRATKVIQASDALRRAIEGGGKCGITIVPIVAQPPYDEIDPKYVERPVDVEYVKVVTYR